MKTNKSAERIQIMKRYPVLLKDIKDKNPSVSITDITAVLQVATSPSSSSLELYSLINTDLRSSFFWTASTQGHWFWNKVNEGYLKELIEIERKSGTMK